MNKLNILLAAALCVGLFILTGCTTTQKITSTTDATGTVTTVTNSVSAVDPVRLQQIGDIIEPAASSALRRAIAHSPQHAAQIGVYARALGSVFCQMKASQTFDPVFLITAADAATAQLQDAATPEIIDGKNAAIAIYKIAVADRLTVDLPNNAWLSAVCGLFCDSITQALKDSGQAGVK
jgi:hypothetical protein